MKALIAAALPLFIAATVPVRATDVVDDFESGNPNQWGWINNSGINGTINPDGGHPGAWNDSEDSYYSDHPNFSSIPPAGSALAKALASGTLTGASVDIERIASSCAPGYDLPSAMSIELIDLHSDPGGAVVEAHTIDGPAAPTGPSDWATASFTIPSDSSDDVPPGWELNAPPELGYTWPELMQNIDGIRIFVINPDDITYDACWHLGADNVVVSYAGGDDTIFADGFDIVPLR